MRDIYSAAEVVYIWLGKGNARTDAAMDYLAKGGFPFRSNNYTKDYDDVPTGNTIRWRLACHFLTRFATFRRAPHHDGLNDIFDRPWIQRIWVSNLNAQPEMTVLILYFCLPDTAGGITGT